MNETTHIEASQTDPVFKKYIPIVTAFLCLVSVILFIGINLEEEPYNWEVYKKWGSPSRTDIFSGSYWGLITSNFLHTELWHIAFNLYWLIFLGKKIEFETNKLFYGLLILSSALVSSLSQLSFDSTTGIGLSGIGYSLFGFILLKSKTTESYSNYLEKGTIRLFILWLFLCIVLTQMGIWHVGNAAHIGGFLWGMTLAYLSKFNIYKQWIAGLLLFSALATSIFWNPFSTSWLSYRAFELHTNQQYNEARQVYNEILSIDKDNQWAKDNLKILPAE